MPYAATSGCASCAMISIGSFKGPGDQKKINEDYKKDPKTFVEPKEGLTVSEFSSKIIFPTSQPLGKTKDLPFEKLMEDIRKSSLKDKFTLAVLNMAQFHDGYWKGELLRWGFKLMSKTNNNIGSTNYIFVRAPLEVPIKDNEK